MRRELSRPAAVTVYAEKSSPFRPGSFSTGLEHALAGREVGELARHFDTWTGRKAEGTVCQEKMSQQLTQSAISNFCSRRWHEHGMPIELEHGMPIELEGSTSESVPKMVRSTLVLMLRET